MNTQQDEQLKEIENLLKKLGYDMTKEEKKLFVDVVVEAMDCLENGIPKSEVFNLLHDKNGYIYVELAYFCYELGMPWLHKSLEEFHQSRRKKTTNKNIFNRVFENEKKPDVFDSAYYVASYLSQATDNTKQKIKVKSTLQNVK